MIEWLTDGDWTEVDWTPLQTKTKIIHKNIKLDVHIKPIIKNK